MLVDFTLTLLKLSETNLQIQVALQIQVTICFFYGAPYI